MITERQRWNLLNKLDMGYSLDNSNVQPDVIEDIIMDDNEFYKASHGLCTRTEYMQKKLELDMFFATMKEPPTDLIDLLLSAKKNVQAYLSMSKV